MFIHKTKGAMFIHIPKCGGKTITHVRDYDWVFVNILRLKKLPEHSNQPQGHSTYMDAVPLTESFVLCYSRLEDIDILTSLRDPVEWYASYYAYYWEKYKLEPFEQWRHKFINAGDDLALAGLRTAVDGSGHSLKNIAQNYEKILQLDCGVMTKYFLSCTSDFTDIEDILKTTNVYDFYNKFCKANYMINFVQSKIERHVNKGHDSAHYRDLFTEKEKKIIRHKERLIYDIVYNNTHEPVMDYNCQMPLQQLPETLNGE
tara:strand:+ start:5704 stop:6480 length:777 start_codon:yes stop_codon:yes gene_type:complete